MSGKNDHHRPGCCDECHIYLDYKDSHQCSDDQCQCHQRPDHLEKDCKLGYPEHLDCEYEAQHHQRPERAEEWDVMFDTIFYSDHHQDGVMRTAGQKKRDDLVDFVRSLIAAAEQRSAALEKELDDSDTEIRNLELQNTRLHENNQELTKKLRAAKRDAFEQVLATLPPNLEILETDVDSGWQECLATIKRQIKNLLAYQQEPKDL